MQVLGCRDACSIINQAIIKVIFFLYHVVLKIKKCDLCFFKLVLDNICNIELMVLYYSASPKSSIYYFILTDTEVRINLLYFSHKQQSNL